ncbi:hypothetical protein LIA77_09670 [Sarocladium implicatum]|nr:hypothetical protein LIA77_09670 [Sarocladium implicatum]
MMMRGARRSLVVTIRNGIRFSHLYTASRRCPSPVHRSVMRHPQETVVSVITGSRL